MNEIFFEKGEKMEIKKLIIVSLILLTLVCSIAAISAETNKNLKIDGNTATFHGVKFNIPDGYEVSEDESIDKNNQMQSEGDDQIDGFVLEDKNHKITIYVMYGEEYTLQDAMEWSEIVTINGVEGSIEKDIGGTGTQLFSYIYDGKLVWITGNDETLKEMVVSDGKEHDTSDVSVDGDTLTVHGEKFKIPKGYKLKYKDQDNETTLAFMQKDVGDEGSIMIQVDYDDEYDEGFLKMMKDVDGFEGKTINNIDGLTYESDDSDGLAFMYPSNGAKVTIVGASEDIIKQVLS